MWIVEDAHLGKIISNELVRQKLTGSTYSAHEVGECAAAAPSDVKVLLRQMCSLFLSAACCVRVQHSGSTNALTWFSGSDPSFPSAWRASCLILLNPNVRKSHEACDSVDLLDPRVRLRTKNTHFGFFQGSFFWLNPIRWTNGAMDSTSVFFRGSTEPILMHTVHASFLTGDCIGGQVLRDAGIGGEYSYRVSGRASPCRAMKLHKTPGK